MDDGSPPTPRIAWQPTRQDGIYPLHRRQALWIRFTVPPAPDDERWYLEIPYPGGRPVTLYTQDSVGQWVAQAAGDTVPVASWPVPHRHPLLPIAGVCRSAAHVPAASRERRTASARRCSFVSESYLSRSEQRTSLILGIYFGLAGLAAVLALLSAVIAARPRPTAGTR